MRHMLAVFNEGIEKGSGAYLCKTRHKTPLPHHSVCILSAQVSNTRVQPGAVDGYVWPHLYGVSLGPYIYGPV